MWKLSNVKSPNVFALHSQGSTYPVGKAYWKVKLKWWCQLLIFFSNPVRLWMIPDATTKTINWSTSTFPHVIHLLSPVTMVSASQWRKGSIPPSKVKVQALLFVRCDQSTDCEDVSDEKGCKIIVIDEKNYLKDKPPKNAVVKIMIELLKILEIGEVNMLFRNQFKLYMESYHILQSPQRFRPQHLGWRREKENLDSIPYLW